MDEADEAAGEVVIAGGDAAAVLQSVDTALNAMTQGVDRSLDAVLNEVVPSRSTGFVC